MRHRLSCTVFAGMWALALAGPALSAEQQSGSSAGGVILSAPPDGALVTEKEKPKLTLSGAQQQAVITGILERKSHQPTPKEFKAELGGTITRHVEVHTMPPQVANDIPALKEYTYAHLDKTIVIVDAMDKKIAALIPLPANLAQDKSPDPKAAPVRTIGGLPDLKPEQRRALYQSAQGEAQPVPQEALLAGAQVPESITLQPLPADVLAQTPQAKDWQYARLQDGRMLLVDPKKRTVAGIITQDEGTNTAKAGSTSGDAAAKGSGETTGTNDPLREREESGKPSAYTGPATTGPNTD